MDKEPIPSSPQHSIHNQYTFLYGRFYVGEGYVH